MANDHGDIVALADEAGEVFARYAYGPFGEVEAAPLTRATSKLSAALAAEIAAANPLRYAGYVYDTWSGHYYLQARYYDPQTKQFISKDPAEADGEESAYQYCAGDPVHQIDPTGLWGWGGLTKAFTRVRRSVTRTIRRAAVVVRSVAAKVTRRAVKAVRHVKTRIVTKARAVRRSVTASVRRVKSRVRTIAAAAKRRAVAKVRVVKAKARRAAVKAKRAAKKARKAVARGAAAANRVANPFHVESAYAAEVGSAPTTTQPPVFPSHESTQTASAPERDMWDLTGTTPKSARIAGAIGTGLGIVSSQMIALGMTTAPAVATGPGVVVPGAFLVVGAVTGLAGLGCTGYAAVATLNAGGTIADAVNVSSLWGSLAYGMSDLDHQAN